MRIRVSKFRMPPRTLGRGALLSLAVLVALWVPARAQTVVQRGSVIYNAQINSNLATYTNIYVVFPPGPGTHNYSNFSSRVMGSNYIDGVTLQIAWSQIETNDPTTTPCSAPGTDTCQQDGSNSTYYHAYDWTPVDPGPLTSNCGDMSSAIHIAPWFCEFGGVNKTVNFILTGINGNPTNASTPTYVTRNQTWIAAVSPSYAHQDVINTSNTQEFGSGGCGGYSGSISVPALASFQGGSGGTPTTTVSVTWNDPSPHPAAGDTIWVSGFSTGSTKLNNITQWGSIVTTSGCSADFCYTVPMATASVGSGASASIVNAVDSWPVPFEESFAAGYLAFLRAAIYHFNHLNHVDLVTGLQETVAQVRYVRPGLAVGGEAQPICPTSNVMANTSPGYSQPEWIDQTTPTVAWYTRVAETVQSASPLMQIMYSINVEGTSKNASFATDEAKLVINYGNAIGMYSGFGSQGLAQTDNAFAVAYCPDGTSAPDTGNNWGCMFLKYWSGANTSEYANLNGDPVVPTTVGLELQQIDCSNPCAAGACGSFNGSSMDQCYSGPKPGLTGDLRSLLSPFVAQHHVSFIELYSQDALLAFDPNFCDVVSSSCSTTNASYDTFGTALTPGSQYQFYEQAGNGGTCTPGTNCYSDAIEDVHGPH